MSREEEIKEKLKGYYRRPQKCEDLMQVHLGDISLTLAMICDSLERITGYLESPYSVTSATIVSDPEEDAIAAWNHRYTDDDGK